MSGTTVRARVKAKTETETDQLRGHTLERGPVGRQGDKAVWHYYLGARVKAKTDT